MGDENERRERRKGFDRIDMGAIGALAPERDRTRRRIEVVAGRQEAVRPDLADDVGNSQRRRQKGGVGEIAQFG